MSDENITMEELHDAGYEVYCGFDGLWCWALFADRGSEQSRVVGFNIRFESWQDAFASAAADLAESRTPDELTGMAYIESLYEKYANDMWFVVKRNGLMPVFFYRSRGVWLWAQPAHRGALGGDVIDGLLRTWDSASASNCTTFGPSDVPKGEKLEGYIEDPELRDFRDGDVFCAKCTLRHGHTHKITIFAEPLDQTK